MNHIHAGHATGPVEQPYCENQAKVSFSHSITDLQNNIVALSNLDTIWVI